MTQNKEKQPSYGVTTVSFGEELLARITRLASTHTNGNASEFIRIITESTIEKIEDGQIEIKRGKHELVAKK